MGTSLQSKGILAELEQAGNPYTVCCGLATLARELNALEERSAERRNPVALALLRYAEGRGVQRRNRGTYAPRRAGWWGRPLSSGAGGRRARIRAVVSCAKDGTGQV